jgi:putative ABC transport system substrate-binding protein
MNSKFKTCSEPFDSAQDKLHRRIQNLKLAIAASALFLTLAASAEAQQAKGIPRISYLEATPIAANKERIEAFRDGLRELGYVEGKNIVIDLHSAEGRADRLPSIAAELVRTKVDVIVTGGPAGTRIAKQATSTIPIVMTFDNDPVGSGFAASLARPGGNITGLSIMAPEITGKRLEFLKEIVPKLSRLAIVASSSEPGYAQTIKETESVAGALKVQLEYLDVMASQDIENAIAEARKGRADALMVLSSPILIAGRKQLTDLAIKSRLPAIYYRREFVETGGLMSYGVNFSELSRRAAYYVDKILKGAKPGDLPVEQPTKFELVINLKAAKQIGLTIPPNMLARADKVIK